MDTLLKFENAVHVLKSHIIKSAFDISCIGGKVEVLIENPKELRKISKDVKEENIGNEYIHSVREYVEVKDIRFISYKRGDE